MLDDLRSALRQIHRSPAFSAAVVLTLALGVGATTAVFTLADPMLFRALPYPDADRLVVVGASGKGMFGFIQVPDFLRAESSHRGFEAIAEFTPSIGGRVSGAGDSILAYEVSRGFFNVLRVRPMLGREFLPGEYAIGVNSDAAMLTFNLWQTAFGGRADVLEQPLDLDWPRPRRFRIVGVLPRDFVLPEHVNRAPAVILPHAPDLATAGNPNRLAHPIARLAPGVSPAAAAAEMQAILRDVEREYPQFPQGRSAALTPLREELFGRVRTPLLMLLGATACVLLLASANLAHLFMARLSARTRELSVRLALGAGRGQLTRLLMVEACLFAVAGGAAALFFGQWVFDLIMASTPEFSHVYRLLPARLDWRVAAFAAALVGVALTIFGAIPAYSASRMDIRSGLQSGAAVTLSRRVRTPSGLIFVQAAVAIAVLVTGALIVRSFVRLAYQPLGFEPDRVRTIALELPGTIEAQRDPAAANLLRRQIYEHLRERLATPVTIAGGWPAMTLPGAVTRPDIPKGPSPVAYPVAGTFFDVFTMRLLRGRLYDDREAFGNAPVVVVDRRAAEKLWPGEDALGRVLQDRQGTARVVIGVIETLRTRLTDDATDGTAFVPFAPQPRSLSLAFRHAADIGPEQVAAAVQEVAPGARVTVRPFLPFERTLGQPRFLAALLGTLGLLTIALTIVGVFGVVNHEVARRTREMGIRISLGANRARVCRLVLRRAVAPALGGVMAGGLVALWWTRTLRALLFGLQPNDPSTFAMAALLVAAVVLLAALLPAWRASRVDPVVALRLE